MRERISEARGARKFAELLAEIEEPFSLGSTLQNANAIVAEQRSKKDALDELINLLVSRNGIYLVLRRYEQEGISDHDRLKNLYWNLMAGSCGPTTSGKCVATAGIYDPTFLMFLLQKESEGLNTRQFGLAAWKFAEKHWQGSN